MHIMTTILGLMFYLSESSNHFKKEMICNTIGQIDDLQRVVFEKLKLVSKQDTAPLKKTLYLTCFSKTIRYVHVLCSCRMQSLPQNVL